MNEPISAYPSPPNNIRACEWSVKVNCEPDPMLVEGELRNVNPVHHVRRSEPLREVHEAGIDCVARDVALESCQGPRALVAWGLARDVAATQVGL
jgi:hypothetical protein